MASEIPTSFENQLALEQVNLSAPGAQSVDAGAQIQAAIGTAEGIVGAFDRFDERAKAKAFEEVLKGGTEAMEQYVQQLQAEGFDVSNIPDAELYGRTQESQANWYKLVNSGVEKQTKARQAEGVRKAGAEGIEQASGGDIAGGIQTAVKGGALPVSKGFEQIAETEKSKRLQDFLNPPQKPAVQGPQPAPGATPQDSAGRTGIKNLIKKIESGGNADSFNSKKGKTKKDFTPSKMTIGDIKKAQGSNDIFAVGLYQLIPSTLAEAVANTEGIDDSTVFDEATQEKLADYIIDKKRPLIGKFLRGEIPLDDSVKLSLAKEWAAFPVPHDIKRPALDSIKAKNIKKGQSYYADTGIKGVTNKAADISEEDIENALRGGLAFGGEIIESDITQADLDTDKLPQTPEGIQAEIDSIESEKKRLTGSAELSADPAVKVKLQVLEQRKDDLAKKLKKAVKAEKTDNKGSQIAETLEILIAQADKVPAKGRIPGFLSKLGAKLFGTDADVKTMEDFKGLLAGQVAKGIGGESGRLTDQDRLFAMRSLPDVTDTTEEREIKVRILTAIMENLRDTEGTSEERGARLRDAVRGGAKELAKAQRKAGKKVNLFPIENLPDTPTDEEITVFLESNGKKVSPQNVEAVRKAKGGSATPAPTPIPTPEANAVPTPLGLEGPRPLGITGL